MYRLKNFFIIPFLLILWFLPADAEEIIYSKHELLGNGNFEEDYRSWFSINCNPSRRAAKNGKFGMHMSGISSLTDQLTFLQNIIIPSELSKASISFDYRVRQWAEQKQSAELKVIIGKSRGFDSYDFTDTNLETIQPVQIIYSNVFDTSIEWQHVNLELQQAALTEILSAQGENHFIFLQCILKNLKSEPIDLDVHIDNLSFKIDGKQRIPKMDGLIAYMGRDESAQRDTINLLDPNTNDTRTIWKYPKAEQNFKWKDLKWRPDSKELAFVSDFESPFSPTYTNIYALKPTGEGLRKISNPPLQKTIEKGDFPKIKVAGSVKNNPLSDEASSAATTIQLWIQGAPRMIQLKLKPNAEQSFEIDDVSLITGETDQFKPIVVMYWSNSQCAFGVEYERPVSDISFSKADIGILSLDGMICNEGSEVNAIRNITWNWDGSQLGFAMIGGLRKISAEGQSVFDSKELLTFSKVKWPDHMAWSPVNDQYLYYDYDLPSTEYAGIYLAEENEDPRLLVNDAKSTSPAWLPDGSGFLYVKDSYEDRNIYLYKIDTGIKKRLTYFSNESIENLCVSGDGSHLVFELRNTWVSPVESDLWIVNIDRPTQMWQVTHNHKSTHPDWSRSALSLPSKQSIQSSISPVKKVTTHRAEKEQGCFIWRAMK